MIEVSRRVLDLAKNFSTVYPNLGNLKKFNKFEYKKKLTARMVWDFLTGVRFSYLWDIFLLVGDFVTFVRFLFDIYNWVFLLFFISLNFIYPYQLKINMN